MDYSFLYKKNERFGIAVKDACEILLHDAGAPLHVNELHRLLRASSVEFKGNNPIISIAVLLNRDRRFCKVAPGTFYLTTRGSTTGFL